MLYVALLMAGVALFVAWRCSRATRQLKERNSRLSSQLNDLRLDLFRQAEAHHKAMAGLRFEVLRQAGDLKVTGDMTVDDVTALHPQAVNALAGFHIGGCASCAVDGSTRLKEAVAANGGQLEPLLIALNELVAQGGDGVLPLETTRMPNMQLGL